jgi:hypothetical protein
MTATMLAEYGLVPVARVHIADRKLVIEITDHETVKLDKCVYAILIGDEVARVGSSKAPLRNRLKSYERDITGALNGGRYHEEAPLWSEKLTRAGFGIIFARQGTLVTTPVGEFRTYLDEESLLIGRFHHVGSLNRGKHR